MSKDEKEQEFRVSDKRRFKMDEDGEITDTKQPDAKEETKTEEKEAKSEEQTEQQQQEDKEFCEEKFKDVPPVNFTTLIFSLSTQAMVSLGELPDPMTQEISTNNMVAKQAIDLLGILDEKTKGNLSPEEEQFLKSSLTDLRLLFVQKCKSS